MRDCVKKGHTLIKVVAKLIFSHFSMFRIVKPQSTTWAIFPTKIKKIKKSNKEPLVHQVHLSQLQNNPW